MSVWRTAKFIATVAVLIVGEMWHERRRIRQMRKAKNAKYRRPED